MHAPGSTELVRSPTPGYAALLINRELADIADQLPEEVRLGYSGEAFTLQVVAGVGTLRAINLGRLHRDNPSVRVEASEDPNFGELGYFQDYLLRYGNHRPVPVEYARASDLLDCPVPLPTLVTLVRVLRNAYVDSLQPSATIFHFPTGQEPSYAAVAG